jgi:hypothetical protein
MHRRHRIPGTPLKNLQWEKFCRAYVCGATAGNAAASYRAAGYSARTQGAQQSNGYRLLQIPEVAARMAELQKETLHIEEGAMQTAMERMALRKEAVLGEMAKVGFGTIADYVRQTPEGELVFDFSALERDRGAGIVEFHMTETTEDNKRKSSVRIKMGGKVLALGLLGKHLGLFVDRKENEHESLRHVSTDELRQELAVIDRKLGDAGGGAAAPAEADDRQGDLPPPGPDEA